MSATSERAAHVADLVGEALTVLSDADPFHEDPLPKSESLDSIATSVRSLAHSMAALAMVASDDIEQEAERKKRIPEDAGLPPLDSHEFIVTREQLHRLQDIASAFNGREEDAVARWVIDVEKKNPNTLPTRTNMTQAQRELADRKDL